MLGEVIEVDLTKKVCPSTLIFSLKAVNENKEKLKRGNAKLVIQIDHEPASRTIPRAVKAMGYNTKIEKSGSLYIITITGVKSV